MWVGIFWSIRVDKHPLLAIKFHVTKSKANGYSKNNIFYIYTHKNHVKLEDCRWKFNSQWENQWNRNCLKLWIRHKEQTKKKNKIQMKQSEYEKLRKFNGFFFLFALNIDSETLKTMYSWMCFFLSFFWNFKIYSLVQEKICYELKNLCMQI